MRLNSLLPSVSSSPNYFEVLTRSQALDLMEKLLTFSPKRRIEVTEALAHSYLSVRLFLLPSYFLLLSSITPSPSFAPPTTSLPRPPPPPPPPSLPSASPYYPSTNRTNPRPLSQPYHDPADEPTADQIDPSFFDFDNGDPLGKEDLKGAFFVVF